MVTSPFIVYALLDPRTYDVRYVGKSSSMFKRARAKHSAHCACWIKSLKAESLEPIVRVLSFEDDHDECLKDEIRWIAFFRGIGADLTNIMDGGEGISPGYRQTPEAIEKRVAKLRGRKRDPTIGRKISAALSGRCRVIKKCPQCGKEFSVMFSRLSRPSSMFCNKDCKNAFKKDQVQKLKMIVLMEKS